MNMEIAAFLFTMFLFPVIYWMRGYKVISLISLAVFILNSLTMLTNGYPALEGFGIFLIFGLFAIAKPDSLWFNIFYNEKKRTKSLARHLKNTPVPKKERSTAVDNFISSGNISKKSNPVDKFLKTDEKEKQKKIDEINKLKEDIKNLEKDLD